MKQKYLLISKISGVYSNIVEWDRNKDEWVCPEDLIPVSVAEVQQLAYYAQLSTVGETVTQVVLVSADIFDMFKTTLSDKWIKVDKENNAVQPGFKYNSKLNAFIPPKPFESWILNEETYQWNSLVPYPIGSEQRHVWDEESKNWKELNN